MALLDGSHAEGVEGLMALLRNILAAMDDKEPLSQEYELWDQFL